MKHFIVTFGDNGARITKGITPSDWRGKANVLINPDLSAVKGVPPHMWRLVDGKVVSMESKVSKIFNKIPHHWVFWLKVIGISFLTQLLVRHL